MEYIHDGNIEKNQFFMNGLVRPCCIDKFYNQDFDN